jgi:hypothetical protein
MNNSVYHIRSYRNGDETLLIDLWHRSYKGYGGYVARSLTYWRWCILDRPEMTMDDICLVEKDGVVLGYGVLGPQGKILEIVVQPSLPKQDRKKLTARLCVALESRAKEKGEETIVFSVPSGDEAICEALRDCDCQEETGEFLNLTIVNPITFIQRLLEHRRAGIPQGWRKTFLVELANGRYRFNPFHRFHVEIGDSINVRPVMNGRATDCHIHTDLSVFTDLAFNRLSFESAVETGELRVDPPSELYEAEQFFTLVTLRAPWYSPFADAR